MRLDQVECPTKRQVAGIEKYTQGFNPQLKHSTLPFTPHKCTITNEHKVSGLIVWCQWRSRERCKQHNKNCLVKMEGNNWSDMRQEHTNTVEGKSVHPIIYYKKPAMMYAAECWVHMHSMAERRGWYGFNMCNLGEIKMVPRERYYRWKAKLRQIIKAEMARRNERGYGHKPDDDWHGRRHKTVTCHDSGRHTTNTLNFEKNQRIQIYTQHGLNCALRDMNDYLKLIMTVVFCEETL